MQHFVRGQRGDLSQLAPDAHLFSLDIWIESESSDFTFDCFSWYAEGKPFVESPIPDDAISLCDIEDYEGTFEINLNAIPESIGSLIFTLNDRSAEKGNQLVEGKLILSDTLTGEYLMRYAFRDADFDYNGVLVLSMLSRFNGKWYIKACGNGLLSSKHFDEELKDESDKLEKVVPSLQNFVRGQHAQLSPIVSGARRFFVEIRTRSAALSAFDFLCFSVDAEGRLLPIDFQSNSAFPFFRTADQKAVFLIDMGMVPNSSKSLLFVLSIAGTGMMRQLDAGELMLSDIATGEVLMRYAFCGSDFGRENAVVLTEFYNRADKWHIWTAGQRLKRIRLYNQDFASGIAIAKDFVRGQNIKLSQLAPKSHRFNIELSVQSDAPNFIFQCASLDTQLFDEEKYCLEFWETPDDVVTAMESNERNATFDIDVEAASQSEYLLFILHNDDPEAINQLNAGEFILRDEQTGIPLMRYAFSGADFGSHEGTIVLAELYWQNGKWHVWLEGQGLNWSLQTAEQSKEEKPLVELDFVRDPPVNLANAFPDAEQFGLFMLFNGESSPLVDFVCFGLDANYKLSDERYMIFFNQELAPNDSIELRKTTNGEDFFHFDLSLIPDSVEHLVFTASSDKEEIDGLTSGYLTLLECTTEHSGRRNYNSDIYGECDFSDCKFSSQTSLILAEIYRESGEWHFLTKGQEFEGDLNALLQHFGGKFADETASTSDFSHSSSSQLFDSVDTQASELQQMIDATPHGATIQLPHGEHRGPIRINRALTIESKGAVIWVANGPVVSIESEGVILRGIQIEVTDGTAGGDSDVALFVKGTAPILDNVDVRGRIIEILPTRVEKWQLPTLLDLGAFAPRTINSWIFSVEVPVDCYLRATVSGLQIKPAQVTAGQCNIEIVAQHIGPDTFLVGQIEVEHAGLVRVIPLLGRADVDALPVQTKRIS